MGFTRRFRKDITHIATDKNGGTYGFNMKPIKFDTYWWFPKSGPTTKSLFIGCSDPTNWENSLEEHPTLDDMIDTIEMAISSVLKDSTLSKSCAIEVCKALNIY